MSQVEVKAAPKSFARRDAIRALEKKAAAKWAAEKTFEVEVDPTKEKFMVTFPYPYMNGRLHLGHAFSLTKAEFTARYQRLLGKNVLFPFGFHCTGMPIQAAANKLKEEIATYGCPPVFPVEVEAAEEAPKEDKAAEQAVGGKFAGKKSKLVQKGQAGNKPMRQWDILSKMVPLEEIPEFADPMKWLNYFPPLGVEDLKEFGSAIDWRRSFITTSVSPVYDSFIRWQFNTLHRGNRIRSGFRPNVYSVKDKQVCADHDRSSGEGVGPQEYTIVKLEILSFPETSPLNHPALQGKKIYLAPATLRPETMYGQTNCFVLPEGEYGAFEFKNGEIMVMSERAALGLAHQDYALEWGKTLCHVKLTGQDLLGLPLKAPLATYEVIYTLPLMTISMGKGTGVVTSVPSDAPDDFVALKELKDKPLWREKFGLTTEMVEPFEVVPIIEIPGYGDKSAVTMCERLDIKSTKDKDKLKAAKDEVYLKGFYEGIMLVGECAGMKVCDAKPIVRKTLLEAGHALAYFEPESTVIGRSGDECVVALTDQWYLSYGDEQWRSLISTHIHSEAFNSYNAPLLESFDKAIAWLQEWACSREFGLGTQLPWDTKWVIDSLSDSTVYMALYTIAHRFFGGEADNLAGTNGCPCGISPEALTDEIYDYIFLRKPLPAGFSTTIETKLLDELRTEFEYWYPMDLRVSAKDLIPNHLTMCLYNHAEVWKDQPQLWPRGIYCNGHIMVDAEKMSKSKGNFLMLLESVEEFTADATRFALADAGDSLEDANFDRQVANQAITYLYNEEEWIRTVFADVAKGALRTGEECKTWMDRAFANEVDCLIEAAAADYSRMCYRDGIHRAWFDMIIVRDFYRDWSIRTNTPLHQEVILRFIYVLSVIMSPITPHWCEHIYAMFGHTTSVCTASWPQPTGPVDKTLRKEYVFFRDFLKNFRLGAIKTKVVAPKCAHVYLASTYEAQKIEVLQYMQTQCDTNGVFPATFVKDLKPWLEAQESLKVNTKGLMQFAAFMRDEAGERGVDALATVLPINQKAILEANRVYVLTALDLAEISFNDVEAEGVEIPGDKKKIALAVPGKPSFAIYCGTTGK
uniref:leucine--tRNA ligase n=1 Tax=Spumella elongata TaxID=89044 RepID=A0A7S3LYW7_9STRA